MMVNSLAPGKPMAKLVPTHGVTDVPHLADVEGWLEDEDPFFAALDDIYAQRAHHAPRVLRDEP